MDENKEAYKVVSVLADGTIVSAVLWRRPSQRREYKVGEDTLFDGEPGMAFDSLDHARQFYYSDGDTMARPRIYRCKIEPSPLNGVVHFIPWADAETLRWQQHGFWQAVQEGSLADWKKQHDVHYLYNGTILCSRIRLLEDVTDVRHD